jgi:exopolyphosphatase/guanosine-5'-triphosphate,3'-diphosphate pyrophosphatase
MPTSPRWEWRTFGNNFGAAEALIRAHAGHTRERVETYIVSDQSNANVKLRDGLLDIRTLQQINAHGLELWLPLMKAGFPLTAGTVSTVRRAWGLPSADPEAAPATARQFLDDVVSREPGLTAIAVTKRRTQFSIAGCMVEVADLAFDGAPIRTIAVEMTDAGRVWSAVTLLGLSTYDKESYVRALKRYVSSALRYD